MHLCMFQHGDMAIESRLDHVYRNLLLTKFFTKGWGDPENLNKTIRNVSLIIGNLFVLDSTGSCLKHTLKIIIKILLIIDKLSFSFNRECDTKQAHIQTLALFYIRYIFIYIYIYIYLYIYTSDS